MPGKRQKAYNSMSSTNTFELKIFSPAAILFSGDVRYCSIMTPEGSVGFEARHEPFMAVLNPGSAIHYRDPIGKEVSLTVKGGLLSFRANSCTIVTEQKKTKE